MRNHHPYTRIKRAPQAQGVTQMLAKAVYRALITGMGDESNLLGRKLDEVAIAAGVGRVYVLGRGQPFDGSGAARCCGVEPVQRRGVVG